jgi:hypothetical protein
MQKLSTTRGKMTAGITLWIILIFLTIVLILGIIAIAVAVTLTRKTTTSNLVNQTNTTRLTTTTIATTTTTLLNNSTTSQNATTRQLPQQLANSGIPSVQPVWVQFPLAPRIINGEESKASSWPWQVSLFTRDGNTIFDYFCSGSLIYENYVLTAAHCAETISNVNNVAVVVGAHSINRSTINSNQIYFVSNVSIHQNYSSSSLELTNDIAIIKLTTNVTIDSNVNTIRLPQDLPITTIHNQRVIITGW